MKRFIILTLFMSFSLLVYSLDLNDFEKELFKQNLSSSIKENKSGFQIWSEFFYENGSAYKKPKSDGTDGDATEEAHETQGIAHFHHYDNGKIIPDYWVLMKNKYIDIFEFDEQHFFSNYHKINYKNYANSTNIEFLKTKFMDGDFYYDGYFGKHKIVVVPSHDKLFFIYPDESSKNGFSDIEVSKICLINGKCQNGTYNQDDPAEHDWSYLAIFPKTGMIFKPLNEIHKIRGLNVIEKNNEYFLAERVSSVNLQALQLNKYYHNILDADGNQSKHGNWIQGGSFSPNGRFFYNVHDDDKDSLDYTGIYIYYVPDKAYKTLIDVKDWVENDEIELEFYLIGFIHIKEKMEGDGWAKRNIELEGLDIFPASADNGKEYDIHLLVLNNEAAGEENYAIYHYESGDYDRDEVKDVYDNCPFHENGDQKDWNNNGIGDACEDYDEDGVFDADDNCIEIPNSDQNDWNDNGKGDACENSDKDEFIDADDNCPGVYNPDQKDWDGNGIGDMCDDYDEDKWLDYEDACPNVVNCIKCQENCRFSTSECCSRERSHCDMDGDGRWDLEPYLELNSKFDLEQFIDHYAYSASGIWEKSRDDVHITDTTSNTYGGTWRGTQETGHKIEIYSQASYFCGQESKPSKLSTYYCYCGKDKESHKRCDDGGACGKNFAEPNQVWDKQFGHTTWLPTPQGFENIEINSGDSCSQNGKFKKIQSKGNYETLDYKNDPVLGGKIFDTEGYEVPHPRTEEEKQELLDKKNYPLLKLSFGVVTGNPDDYLKEIGKDEYEVNKEYFSNYDQTPLHGEKDKLILAKKSGKLVDIIIEDIPYFRAEIIPGYGKWWYDMMWDYLGRKPWDDPRWELGFEDILKDTLYESIARPSEFTEVGFDGNSITAELVSFHDDYNQIFRFGGRNAVYFKDGNTFSIAFNDVNGIFNEVYSVPEGIPMRSAAVTTVGTEIFMAAGMDNMILHKRKKPDATEIVPIRTTNFVKITFCGNNLSMMRLAPLPERPVHISLFAIEEKIHAFMIDSRGKGKIIAYSNENDSWEELSAFDFGQEFSLNNMFIKGKDLYFTAPDLENKTTLYSWNSGSGVHKIASIDTDYDAFIKPFSSSKKIILADLKKLGSTVDAWELSNNGFTKITVPVNKPEYKMAFCINENADSVFPGATDFHEKCQSVGNYNYKSKLFFDYKYSLAGYENSLYLGGLTGIRRMEIGENGKLTKKEMLYSGKTKSLAVYKDVLYAANKDEIDLFSISEDGKISRISGLKATDCENLKTENGKLFTAENKQVRIFSLSDPKNPELLKTITVEGSVKDIEILNNKLFVYEETGGCFSKKGTVRIYDVSDLNNITQTQNFEKICKKAEFQKSGDKVYLGCKTETFKVEESSLTKMHGSPKYLRDSYVFDGILYQVFSGTLHKSSVTKAAQPDSDGWF